MNELSDGELLQKYRQGSESAFAELVCRHVNLVYSAAIRHVQSASDAEEVTQAVFIIMARKAGALKSHEVLEGWLFQTTRFTAMSFLRSKRRRQQKEQEFYVRCDSGSNSEMAAWEQLEPFLDEAMEKLPQKDRDAVILRFFRKKNLREVAATLEISEVVAQKRVYRALEKMRLFLAKRGVAVSATLMAGALSTNAVQAAPAALASSVALGAIVQGATTGSSTLIAVKGALKLMIWSKAKTAIVSAVVLVCAVGGGVGIYIGTKTNPTNPEVVLESALAAERPKEGTWSYPSIVVERAISDFGTNRAKAFPIVERALKSSNLEIRKQAVAAMGSIARPMPPRFYKEMGDPATNGIPLLREILVTDSELSYLALSALRGLFDAQDIPMLADLLARSHETMAGRANGGTRDAMESTYQLQRYLPEAIAETIQKNPEEAASFVPSVEKLLDNPNSDVRFGAACALAQTKGLKDSRILDEMTAALSHAPGKFTPYPATPEGTKQLMVIETSDRLGAGARPMITNLAEFAKTTDDGFLRNLSLRLIDKIEKLER